MKVGDFYWSDITYKQYQIDKIDINHIHLTEMQNGATQMMTHDYFNQHMKKKDKSISKINLEVNKELINKTKLQLEPLQEKLQWDDIHGWVIK